MTTIFDRALGLLDRYFIIGYWLPTCVGIGAWISLAILYVSPGTAWGAWVSLDTTSQATVAAVGVLGITAFAYLLHLLTGPIVQFYEGYGWPKRIEGWFTRYATSSGGPLPNDSALYRPTRLGNTIRAAEEHAFSMVKLDTVLWWPRLFALLPENVRVDLASSLMTVVGLLNLATILGFGAAMLGAVFIVLGAPVMFLVAFIGGALLCRVCYLAGAMQAQTYGELIRVSFDLYRHQLLKQMGIAVPASVDDEIILWPALSMWIREHYPPYFYAAQREQEHASVPEWLKAPFAYAGANPERPSASEQSSQRIIVVGHSILV